MLRIRNKDGTLATLPQGCFVEMVNENDGLLGSVWYQRDSCIVRIVPGSQDAQRYEGLFKDVKFADIELRLTPYTS